MEIINSDKGGLWKRFVEFKKKGELFNFVLDLWENELQLQENVFKLLGKTVVKVKGTVC